MESSKNNTIIKWVIPFVVLINAWSFIGGWVTILARTWLWLAIGVLALIFVAPQFFRTKAFAVLVWYSIIVVLNRLSGDEYYGTWAYVLVDIFSLIFYGGLGYYLIHGCDEKVKKITLYGILLVIAFTSIATYVVDMVFPDIVRTMVAMTNEEIDTTPYYRMGVCDYSMPHALPILIAPLLLWLKDRTNHKTIKLLLFIISILFLLLLLVWTSGATTPLLIALFALFVSLLVSPQKTKKKNFLVLVVASVFLLPLTIDSVQLSILHSLENIIPKENSNYGKLKDFEDSILYGSDDAGDVSARKNLYSESISAFGNNLLLGTNNKSKIGGHSIILDRFAMIGIIGAIPYLLFLYYTFKDSYYNTQKQKRIFIVIGIICFFLIIALKNMLGIWMYSAAFVMLPLMVNYDFHKKKTIKTYK